MALFACLALPSMAQDAAPWSVGDIKFSGLIDGYYDYNFNHPASGTNDLYNFNVQANQFSLSMAKVSLTHEADPIGFQLDLGFGKSFDLINGSDSSFRNIEQAYVTWKPEKTGGLAMDFGKFVTSAGAEVIETHLNWNYSRSILFAWAIPYYHFGFRATKPIGSHFTGGFQLVNGWNNVEDNNSGKTVGLTAAFTGSKASWFNAYYTGPEQAGTNNGYRNLFDTNLVLTPSAKFNAYINFDYGRENNAVGPGSVDWLGVAIATRFQLTDKGAFAARGEVFDDRDGWSTGTAQSYKEVTFTYEYKWMKGLLTRFEYRHDWAEEAFFDKGVDSFRKNQDTLTIGFVGYFGQ